jgi:hypothetical protein
MNLDILVNVSNYVNRYSYICMFTSMFTCKFIDFLQAPLNACLQAYKNQECYLGLHVNLNILGDANKCVYMQVYKYISMYVSVCIYCLHVCLDVYFNTVYRT